MDDQSLQHAVTEELDWAPHVDASHLTVSIHHGVVHLQGHVTSLAEKKAANRAVWHLQGVTGVRDDIEVQPHEADILSDGEIARRARQVLLWDSVVPKEGIEVSAVNGTVALTGLVDQPYQRAEAEQRIQHLTGVLHVDNRIGVRATEAATADVEMMVHRALQRHSELDSSQIVVKAQRGQVMLSGTVPSYTQRRIAENAAWSVHGVNEVVDLMRVNR